ncbi:hypothetical protein HPB49_018288 [Dermacentor silvarum]|uniref:Uncharacterized protein n=1 Tax=Dermacentor silvarum TaxID=543639 RepID=A0ACB8CGR7_DERSI|nr:hypothetical protein HPB49_018288 [Dermacentor silvarum]
MISTLSKPDPSERTEHASTPSKEGEFPAAYTFKAWNFDAGPSRPVTQVCNCFLRIGHRHDICPYPQGRRCGNCGVLNPEEHHERCLPCCLTCGSDDHPTIDLGCPARQRGRGPRGVKEECQRPKGHDTTPPRWDTEVSTTNQQPGDIPTNTSSQRPQSTARLKQPKVSYREKKTKQHVQPRVPPTIRTPATPLSNDPPHFSRSAAREVRSRGQPYHNDNPPKHLARRTRGGPASSSSLATGGRLDPDPQLQQRQDPLADAILFKANIIMNYNKKRTHLLTLVLCRDIRHRVRLGDGVGSNAEATPSPNSSAEVAYEDIVAALQKRYDPSPFELVFSCLLQRRDQLEGEMKCALAPTKTTARLLEIPEGI